MRSVRAHSPFARLVAPGAVALLAVGLTACGSPSPPAAQSKGTGAEGAHATTTTTTAPPAQETGFSPFTPEGAPAPGLQVTQKAAGRCTSPGVAGSASYRCTAQPGAVTYDPCFAPPLATKGPLLCVPLPTDMDVTQFSVGALPKASAQTPQKQVWAMRLQNGEVCILVRATWKGLGPFACPTPSATDALADCHAPAFTAHGWTAACQARQDAPTPFDPVPVVDVWN